MAEFHYTVEELIKIAFVAGVQAAGSMRSNEHNEPKLRKLEIEYDYAQWRDNVGLDILRSIQQVNDQ